MPKVSVIMPLYNAEKYIEKTINSLLLQTYKDFEIIVVDDLSTDNSIDIISGIKDERIKVYFNNKNNGIAYTRNKALSLACGEYIAIMDDDDISPNYRLKDETDFLDSHSEIDVVGGNTYVIDSNDNIKRMFAPVIRNPKLIKAALMFENIFGNGACMFRRNFIEKHNITYANEMFGTEDYRFWAECSVLGSMAGIDKVMLYWRDHDNESKHTKDTGDIRKQKITETQRYLMDSYGFCFSKIQYKLLGNVFAENGKLENPGEINSLYQTLKDMSYQAKRMQLDNESEVTMMCRKMFGKKLSTAFFLWE